MSIQTPEVTEKEIDEVISFLRKKGSNVFANRVESLKQIEYIGRLQYAAGLEAILEIESILSQKIPRDLILNSVNRVVENIKKVM